MLLAVAAALAAVNPEPSVTAAPTAADASVSSASTSTTARVDAAPAWVSGVGIGSDGTTASVSAFLERRFGDDVFAGLTLLGDFAYSTAPGPTSLVDAGGGLGLDLRYSWPLTAAVTISAFAELDGTASAAAGDRIVAGSGASQRLAASAGWAAEYWFSPSAGLRVASPLVAASDTFGEFVVLRPNVEQIVRGQEWHAGVVFAPTLSLAFRF